MRAVAVLALLTLAACDTAAPEIDPFSPDLIDLATLSQDADDLVGTWDLVAEAYYQTVDGRPVVSRSSDGAETWTFRADGTATRVQVGDFVLETSYRVAPRDYDNGAQSDRPVLLFGDGGNSEDFGVADDVLVFDNTPVDGPQSRYRRR